MKKTDKQLAQVLWDYMKLEHPLEKADVIIGLGSTDIRTAKWCAKLYKEGWAPIIIFTGANGRMSENVFTESEAGMFSKVAQDSGIPENAIKCETKATNTGENIKFSHKALLDLGIVPKKIILVTKPYMLRRAYATFKKQWPDQNCEIICSGIDQTFEEYFKEKNYPFEYVVNVMVGDLQRILEYPTLGYQIPQKMPQSVIDDFEELIARGYTSQLLETR